MKALDLIQIVSDSLSWGEIETIENENREPKIRKMVQTANLVLRSLQADKDWPELKVEGKLQLQWPQHNITPTVTVTQGNDVIFLTGGIPNGDWFKGCLLSFDGVDEVYRIREYLDSGRYRLHKPWIGTSISTVATQMSILRDTYQMPKDYDRLLSDKMMNISTGNTMNLVDTNEMRAEWVTNGTTVPVDEPTKFTVDGTSPGNKRALRLNRIGQRNYVYTYEYLRHHPELEDDDTEILYPQGMMLHIVDAIVARLNRDVEDSNKAQQVAQDALASRVRGEANPSSGDPRLRFTPKYGLSRRRRRH